MTHRVVVLHGDPEYRLMARLGLEGSAEGFEVVGEAAPDEGSIGLIREVRADVVLLDTGRDGEGLRLLATLSRACPDVLVIILSGFAAEEPHWPTDRTVPVGQISKRVPPSKLATEILAVGAMLELVGSAVDEANVSLAEDHASGRQARRFVDEALQRWACTDLADTVPCS